MSSLTPKTYVMSLTAEEIERRLLSIDNFLLKTIIRQSLLNPATDTVPSTQCVIDALTPINTTISSLGDLALKDSVALDSNETVGILPLSKGGTGGSKLADAQQNLGILTQTEIQTLINNSIPTVQSVDLGSNQVNGVLPVSKGGTGSNAPANALKNLGIHDSNGKVPASQLPDVATHETTTYSVSTQADMTSLNAEQGDFCIRLDTTQTFILTQKPASSFSNWQEILSDSYKRITPQVFQALKRAHAVYGKNLVAGSFESGATVQSSSDALVQETTGNTYSWTGTFPKTVSAGTDPTTDPLWKLVPIGETIIQKPVLSAEWVQKRSAMWTGFGPADGQTLLRSLYPDALAAIQAGLVPVCSDSDWLADPTKRGCFTLGDGSTTFRVPDYNGMTVGSLGAIFQRGDGLNSTGTDGNIQNDAIRNITGAIGYLTADQGVIEPKVLTGALKSVNTGSSNRALGGGTGGAVTNYGIGLDASLVVPTAADNHPVNVTGCWAVRLFGAVQNVGSVDAAALATAVASLAARVSNLEQRKSTCLVNATGTGAPHETVTVQLPANIAVNTRYVLPNPFGVNTPVLCVAEVLSGGKWADPGWAYTGANSVYGVRAGYVQGEGVIVQTGRNYIIGAAVDMGGLGGSQIAATSLPCRIFVRKMEA